MQRGQQPGIGEAVARVTADRFRKRPGAASLSPGAGWSAHNRGRAAIVCRMRETCVAVGGELVAR